PFHHQHHLETSNTFFYPPASSDSSSNNTNDLLLQQTDIKPTNNISATAWPVIMQHHPHKQHTLP
ncbi:unnamed protein product, partial [Rotaria sp. Silwood2]